MTTARAAAGPPGATGSSGDPGSSGDTGSSGDPAVPVAPVVPLRPMSAADVLDGGFRLLRAAPAAILVPALLVAVVITVADTALELALDPASAVGDSIGGGLLAVLLLRLVTGAAGTVAVAVVGAFVAGAWMCTLQGARPGLGAVWALVRGRLLVAALVGLVVAVVQTVALAFLVVPGVWLWGLLALAAPATVVERASVTGALRRSAQLAGGAAFWRVLGLRLLAVLTTLAFGYLFSVPFALLADQVATSTTAVAALGAAGTLLTAAVVLPLRASVDVMLYLDQRIRREAFDVTLALARHPAARPVAAVPR